MIPLVAAIFATVLGLVAGGLNLNASFSSAATLTAGAETLWGTAAPLRSAVAGETNSVELGTKFTPSVSGKVVGVRYWKTRENRGTHVGNLWNGSGKRLASAKFSSETSGGWQTVKFATPVAIAAGTNYVASYLAPRGRYSSTPDFTATSLSSKLLSAPSSDSGVFAYGATTSFPTKSWRSSGYWVDVLFVPSTTATATPAPEPAPAPAPEPAPEPAPAPAPEPAPAPAPAPEPAPAPAPAPEPAPAPSTIGSSFANSGNTGPAAAGFTPTQKYTGPLTITTAGTVIKNQIIPAGLRIEANDVTIQGNIIEGPTDESWDQAALHVVGDRVKILDNTIRGKSATDWTQTPINGIKLVGQYVDFSRNNVYWISGDGVSIYGDNANLVGNWVHDFVFRDGGVHYDGLHYPGQAGDDTTAPALIKDNTVEMWVSGGTSGMTAAMGFPDVATRIVVDHNLVAGGNYTMWGGGSGITYTDNLWWTKFSPKVGYYGPTAYIGKIAPVTWTNNRYTSDGVTPGALLSGY
ncbi:DUF4082 domain-containing protein [Cryobacterium tagatosivorans]|uniref:DUF4082 domain-containing protein n=1 Tax=Cryobacterium tagatosivorans TaxID=1259199 RepID=UPI00141ABB55|nr:DUF4082 domain-containing protein [Cryobacterium tagatosivorans]